MCAYYAGLQVPQVLAELYEGSCFGELALLHNVKRTASIISKGKSEFLRVDKEGKLMGQVRVPQGGQGR
jgi:CRP-like cAMP-binding protein